MIWSYTFLNTLDICPHQCEARYVSKTVPFVETPAMQHGNDVHKAMENRVGKGKVLPDQYREFEQFARPLNNYPVQCEMKLGITRDGSACDFFANDVWGRGKLDVGVTIEDTAMLLDWKTGNVYEKPFELELQALLLKARFPKLNKITGKYVWLKESRLGQTYDVSDTLATWEKVCERVRLAEGYAKHGQWPKKPGPLCSYCDVMTCEHNRKGVK